MFIQGKTENWTKTLKVKIEKVQCKTLKCPSICLLFWYVKFKSYQIFLRISKKLSFGAQNVST